MNHNVGLSVGLSVCPQKCVRSFFKYHIFTTCSPQAHDMLTTYSALPSPPLPSLDPIAGYTSTGHWSSLFFLEVVFMKPEDLISILYWRVLEKGMFSDGP